MVEKSEIVYPTNQYAKAFDKLVGGAPGPTGASPARMGPPQDEKQRAYEETYGPRDTPQQPTPAGPEVEEPLSPPGVSPAESPAPLSTFEYIDLVNWQIIGDNGESFHIQEEFRNTDGVSIRQVILGLCGSIAIAQSNRRTDEMAKRLGFSEPQPPEANGEEVSEMPEKEASRPVRTRRKRKKAKTKQV